MYLILFVILGVVVAAQPVHTDDHRSGARLQSVPLFSRLIATNQRVRSYTAPVTMDVSLHRFIFTFHFKLHGNVKYEAPGHVTFTMDRVPQQYQRLFGDLGEPLAWARIYSMQVMGSTIVDGRPMYSVQGVPRKPSQVDHVVIQTSEPSAPIHAQWVLHDGWTVDSTIEEQNTEKLLFPKREVADIEGHGYKIHTDLQYGNYALDTSEGIRDGVSINRSNKQQISKN